MKAPEVSSTTGAISSTVWADGEPVTAHRMRELIRASNAVATKSTCVYRWVGTVGIPAGELVPAAPARWRYAVPMGPMPARIKADVYSLRVRVRVWIYAGQRVQVSLRSIAMQDDSVYTTIVGGGSDGIQTVEWTTPCRPGLDTLALRWRSLIDPTSDTVVSSAHWDSLSASTFGDATWGTPTLDVSPDGRWAWDRYVVAQYNLGGGLRGWRVASSDANSLQRAGFYIWAYSGGGTSGPGTVHEIGAPSERAASPWDKIYVYDPLPPAGYGLTYTMRALAQARIVSVAAYEVTR